MESIFQNDGNFEAKVLWELASSEGAENRRNWGLKEKDKSSPAQNTPQFWPLSQKISVFLFCTASDIWDSTFWVVLLTDMY